jgi:K+-sensing histidine kinase KdpD
MDSKGIQRTAFALLAWATAWATMFTLEQKLDLANLAMLMVLASALSAMWLPGWASVVVSAVAVMAFNWFFVPPKFAFTVDLHQNALLLVVLLLVNWIIAGLMIRQRRLAEAARILASREARLRQWGDIPAYLKRRGGVSKIRDIEARQLAAKEGESTSKKRMKVLRDFMKWTAIASKDAFDYDQQVWQHRSADQSEEESGEFVVFLTKYDAGRGDYKVAGAYDLGKGREDAVLKILLAQFRQDVPVLEAGLRNFKKKLAQDPSMPEATKKLLLETNRDLLPDADREAIEVQATITTKKSR